MAVQGVADGDFGIDAAQLETALSIAAEMADNMEILLSGERDEL